MVISYILCASISASRHENPHFFLHKRLFFLAESDIKLRLFEISNYSNDYRENIIPYFLNIKEFLDSGSSGGVNTMDYAYDKFWSAMNPFRSPD